jgi:hypothetical protein
MLLWQELIHQNLYLLETILTLEFIKFKDLKSIHKVIATVACGLHSSTQEVVLKTFQVLTAALKEFNADETM